MCEITVKESEKHIKIEAVSKLNPHLRYFIRQEIGMKDAILKTYDQSYY